MARPVSGATVSRRVLLVWGLACVLGLLVVGVERGLFRSHHEHEAHGRQRVFGFSEYDLGAVEIRYGERRARFVRDGNGEWLRIGSALRHAHGATEHAHDHAEPGGSLHHRHAPPEEASTIREQLAVSVRMLADRQIEPTQPLASYGLAPPSAVFTFYGNSANGADPTVPLGRLEIGDRLTTDYSYYTRLADSTSLTLLPRYQVALLLALAFGEDVAPSPLPEPPPSTRSQP